MSTEKLYRVTNEERWSITIRRRRLKFLGHNYGSKFGNNGTKIVKLSTLHHKEKQRKTENNMAKYDKHQQ